VASMPDQVVPLSQLALDLPEPAGGWAAELERRGVVVFEDDLGRLAVDRSVARVLFSEHRAQQEAVARRREEIEQRAIEVDQRFRASLPAGIPAGAVPAGISGGMLMMLSDPERQGTRRSSVVEDALANDGALIYHSIREESS
jgi:hypothetical protein